MAIFIAIIALLISPVLALNCFEEGPDISLRVIGCAYFAFGNTQVCFTKRILANSDNLLDAAEEEDDDEKADAVGQTFGGGQQERGCQYLSRLAGVDFGPAKNLSQELTCASRPWPEDERFNEEICACINDLCNVAASNTAAIGNTSTLLIVNPSNLGVTLTFNTAFLLFSVFIAS